MSAETRPGIVRTVSRSGIHEVGPSGERDRIVKRAVFIDAKNYYVAFTELLENPSGETLGIDRLLARLSQNGTDPIKVSYYTSDPEMHQGFYDLLLNRGVRMVFVPGKQIGNKVKEGPVDHKMSVDIIDQIDTYEEAVILSGDGDFHPAVEVLQARGKAVKIISSWSHIGKELLASGAEIELWEDILPELLHQRKPKTETPHLRAVS